MTEETSRWSVVSWIVLVALALIPPAFATGFTQFEFLKETLLFGFAGAALLGWAGAVLSGRKITMMGGRITTALVVFALFTLFAVIWAPSTELGFVDSASWLSAAVLFLVVTSPVGRPLRLPSVILAVAVGVIASALIGLLELAGLGLTNEVWDPPGVPGAFDAREFAVGYYAIALPLLAAGVVRGGDKVRKAVAGVALALGAVHLGLCADPTTIGIVAGVVALTVAVVGMFQGFARLSLATGMLAGLGLALLVAAGLSLGGPSPGAANEATALPWVAEMHPQPLEGQKTPRDPRFAIPRIEEAPNWEARRYTIGIAFDLFRDEPIVGYGPGGWWANQTKYPRENEPFVAAIQQRYPAFRAPHNGFALVMTEFGLIGLLLFLVWLSAMAGITITALAAKSEPERWLIDHLALTSASAAGVACAIFTPSLQLVAPTMLLFVATALLVRESATLNDFKGMSAVWTINKTGRRWDTTLFCGIGSLALSFLLIGTGAFWGLTSYYRSWGDLAMYRTQHELAVDKYTLAHNIMGGDGELLLNLAVAQQRLGRMQQSRDDVNRAAELREHDVRIINLIAQLHLQDRSYADAVKAARRAVSLFPNYIEARRTLAAALNLQGRMNDSATELVKLLELDPGDAVAAQVHRELAEYYEGPLDNPAKAIDHYQKALELMERKNFMRDKIETSIKEMEKKVERQRLQREGKPIPPELLPQKNNDGHGHGPHDGHGH